MNDEPVHELHSLMERAVVHEHVALAVAEVAGRKSTYTVDVRRSLADRAALEDQIADVAAGMARTADLAAKAPWAEVLWTLVRRSRVNAMNLRARAYG
jgi:hypothetical protein